MAAVTVLSRSSIRPEVLEALMTPDADKEVVLSVLSRPEVTPEHLAWAAGFDNAQILGRVVSNPKTPLPLVREIRQRAEGRPEDIWVHLAAYCGRVIDREVRETGLHKGQGVFREFQSEQTRQTDTNFDQVEQSPEA